MNLALLLSEHILASCMAVSQHFFDSHLLAQVYGVIRV